MHRQWRSILALVLLLSTLFAVVVLVKKPGEGIDNTRDHSITRTNPWGLKALADLCRENGLQVAPWNKPPDELSAAQRALCLFTPLFAVSEEQVEHLLKWVREGGVLVIGAHRETSAQDAMVSPEAIHPLFNALGLELAARKEPVHTIAVNGDQPLTQGVKSLYVPGMLRLEPVGSVTVDDVLAQAPVASAGEAKADDQEPENAAAGDVSRRITRPDLKWREVVSAEEDALVMEAQWGEGRIVALAEVEMLANINLAEQDNVVFAANLLFGVPAGEVFFDEYHKDFANMAVRRAGNLDPSQGLWALWAALAAFALYFISRVQRFGSPVPLQRTPRRSAMEFVTALGDLYRRAEATRGIVEMAQQRLHQRLSLHLGAAPNLPVDVIVQMADAHNDPAVRQAARALRDAQKAREDEKLSEKRMFALIHTMASTEEALDHGRQ